MGTDHNGRTLVALITGASGGIGYELARLFAKDHYDLVLVAPDEQKLMEVADELRREGSGCIHVLPKDLSVSSAPDEIYEELRQKGVQVDILVNNAGFTVYGPHWKTDVEAEQRMLAVNIIALTRLTKLFLREMVPRNAGKILNVGSISSFSPCPLEAVYAATKAYVLSYTESLAAELRGTGVSVTALCPGITDTGFYRSAGMDLAKVPRLMTMNGRPVARAAYSGLSKGRMVVLPGLINKIIAHYPKFTPMRFVLRINEHFLAAMAPVHTTLDGPDPFPSPASPAGDRSPGRHPGEAPIGATATWRCS